MRQLFRSTTKCLHPRVGIATLLISVMLSSASFAQEPSAATVAAPYIVVLHDFVLDSATVAAEHAGVYAAEVGFVYRHALKGYSAEMTEDASVLVSSDPRVRSVQPDTELSLLAQTIPTGVDRVYDPDNNNSRMSGLTINGIDDKRVDADIAIIDTGVEHTHPDLNVVGGAHASLDADDVRSR